MSLAASTGGRNRNPRHLRWRVSRGDGAFYAAVACSTRLWRVLPGDGAFHAAMAPETHWPMAGSPDVSVKIRRRLMSMEAQVIRVVVVDDHALLRDSTRQILEAHPDLQAVGETDSGESRSPRSWKGRCRAFRCRIGCSCPRPGRSRSARSNASYRSCSST